VSEPTPNERLRALRHAHGWTQEQAADAVADAVSAQTRKARPTGIDAQWIGRLERGERRWPNADYRAALRAVYGVATDTELGLSGYRSTRNQLESHRTTLPARHPSPDTINSREVSIDHDAGSSGIDEVNRRELLRALSVAGVLVSLSPDDRTDDRARRVDDADLDDFERLNSHLWQVYSLARSKRAVYPLVREQLELLTNTLKRPQTEASHKRLCVLTGDLFQLAGEVFFDANRYTDSAHCYTLAASASRQADAYDLWACALIRHSFISLYEHDFNGAAPMLDAAGRLAQRGDGELSTRHWVAAVQAEVHAGRGDLNACNQALDTAEAVHDLRGPVHNGGWLRFDGSRLAEQRGACYTRLGRFDLAETALTDALTLRLSSRRRGSVLTDLALLGVERGDIDEALKYGDAAFELAKHTGSGWIGRKLRDVQTRLIPLTNDSRIAELNERIAALNSPDPTGI
jgi:transcriptional regulator with XRE-family HTH domain